MHIHKINPKPVILFDLDGSTYNFQSTLSEGIQQHADIPKEFRRYLSDINNRTRIALRELFEGTPEEQLKIQKTIEGIYQTPKFFETIRPYPGIVDTVHELSKSYNVSFCTKPSRKPCGSENAKRDAVIRDFGEQFSQKVIMAHDKTMVIGDILVDDHPDLQGDYKPAWKQMLVNQPHNQDSDMPRLYLDKQEKWLTQIQDLLQQT